MSAPLTRPQKVFFVLGATFVTCLVVADIIGGAKLVEVGSLGDWPIRFSVGMLAFPVTFVLTDLLNDYFGPRATRFLTLVGLAMLCVVFPVLLAASALPAAPNTMFPEEWFNQIFGSSLRVIIASLTAYIVGQFLDIWVFGVFKRLSKGRFLWLRATGSTIVSQAVDTIIVAFVLFGGSLPAADIWNIIANSYVIKFVIAVAMTPVLYLAHAVLHRVLHLKPLAVGEDPRGV
jgi:hypothetical protein